MKVTFTLKEFLAQVGHFRSLMTDKKFMQGPDDKKDVAIHALHFAYANTEGTKEEIESAACMLKATIDEYSRRNAYLIMRPLRQSLGLTR